MAAQTERWFNAWQNGQTGFHMSRPNPLLLRFHEHLAGAKRVLVPLCGKSLDLVWLAQAGHAVVGIELVPQAIEAFFAEQKRPFVKEGRRYRSEGIDILCGDIFSLSAEELGGPVDAIWDRAALIALEEDNRKRYARATSSWLAPGGRRLLVTVAYDTARMNGPPFSVPDAEVHALFGADASRLESKDCLDENPRFRERGLSSLNESVWLTRA